MNIPEITAKLKDLLERDDLYIFLVLILVGLASFGLGRASVLPPVSLTAVTQTANLNSSGATGAHPGPKVQTTAQNEEMGEEAPLDAQGAASPKYVASKTGSKYHLPWCGGAKQIKEENKVWFQTKEEAEAAGYEPAANCKGI